jgi:hypothetical protein
VGYVVLAIQYRTSNDPVEKIVKIRSQKQFFKDLRRGINGLRGWRGFLSLKSLKAFGVIKVRSTSEKRQDLERESYAYFR